jgi:hypothetical protein
VLTFIEAISLAGDREKQNDDACGSVLKSAWVIDGATDLGSPITDAASDAAWIAMGLNLTIFEAAYERDDTGADEAFMRSILRNASRRAAADLAAAAGIERWQLPTASVLMISEHEQNLRGIDLGDCRCFALDAHGAGHNAGSRANATDDEQHRARDAAKRAGAPASLRDPETMTMLRAARAQHNLPGGSYWVFGLQPECAEHARVWTLPLARPAHVLLCTDGFSALVDRYRAYDAAGIVRAALDKGLQELGRELRAIEAADASGAQHPRFKRSDDATALLLRLT